MVIAPANYLRNRNGWPAAHLRNLLHKWIDSGTKEEVDRRMRRWVMGEQRTFAGMAWEANGKVTRREGVSG